MTARRRAGRKRAFFARWLAMLGFSALVAGSAVAVPEGWFDSVELDAVDAALVERPGAALRHAVASLESGETGRAERLLVAIAARHAIVADVADLERLRLLVLTGRLDDAISLGEAWPHARSPLLPSVRATLGRAYAELGDEENARAAWRAALDDERGDDARAELLMEIARSELRSQQGEAAGETLLEVWVRHPTTEEADEAADALDGLEEQGDTLLRTADRHRRRGDVLYRARHNETALEAYERALALGGLDKAQRRRARAQRAHTLFRLRRYTDAAAAFAELPQDGETRVARARSVARAGDPVAAAKALERIGKEVRGRQGARARLLAALLWEDEGEEERARRLLQSLASGRSHWGYNSAALWRLGWQAYRESRFDRAVGYLDKLEARERSAVGRLRARYWRARAAERAGLEGAAAEFGAIAREFPLTYYGWRASARADVGPSPPRSTPFTPGTATLSPRELQRPRILLAAGLDDIARLDLDALFVRVEGLDDRLALAELYGAAGDFHRAQRLVVDAYRETLARGPGGPPVELWWYAWPVPFREAVQLATESREGLAPELVYAVMREESGYRPRVLSVSGARGLLQLMPDTAERVAQRESLPTFDADDLFLPDVNIQLGAAYLDELLLQFSGRASAAIGSYNAGPHRVVRWLEEGAGEDDEWVEAIPFEQTRSYVKRVLRSVHAYRVLY
ncbi:MAG: transglycosylase SLT domain-containing protein [Myxococcota bacterium]|nr:transglycosylase SLT domain-containing protein [Myxococcota bacterium]